VGQCRPQLDIAEQLASRLNLTGYDDKSSEEWSEEILQGSYVKDVQVLSQKGYLVIKLVLY
jgi:hypothetical protein